MWREFAIVESSRTSKASLVPRLSPLRENLGTRFILSCICTQPVDAYRSSNMINFKLCNTAVTSYRLRRSQASICLKNFCQVPQLLSCMLR